MPLENYLSFWPQLLAAEQARLEAAAVQRTVAAGTVLHQGAVECTGLILVADGQLRAVALSPQGRAITVYRLFARDLCLFSTPCMLKSARFDLSIVADEATTFWMIPAGVYEQLMHESAVVANATNEIMASRFSEVMWLLEQILWRSMDKRLAALLLEEAALRGETTLALTHETLAGHLGSAREVVTRMLRYFQSEGLVQLSRGRVTFTDEAGLRALAEGD